jgi:hypothetical protein
MAPVELHAGGRGGWRADGGVATIHGAKDERCDARGEDDGAAAKSKEGRRSGAAGGGGSGGEGADGQI